MEDEGSTAASAALLFEAARATADSRTLEGLTRPFLFLLQSITGLDSTYLTEVDEEHNEQSVLFALNEGHIEIPENLTVDWQDTLCKRALESGHHRTSDVQTTFPGASAADALGLKTYVSVAVRDSDEHVVGTLCGASDKAIEVSDDVMAVMEMFGQLISDQWMRDKEREQITERAESAERQLRERTMFLAEAEHKLKTPLTILKGWSAMLNDSWTTFSEEDRTTALSTMVRAADQATMQVHELIEESRNFLLANELGHDPVDVSALAHKVVTELKGVSTSHTIVSDVLDGIRARTDERAVWQVLWHLGENAVKYSPDGGSITISLRSEGDEVVIAVTDEGLGIPEDIDVFAPFSRSAEVRFGPIKGTGLGLHIVRNLANAMDGSASAERRTDGPGSRFTVRLPLA